MQCVWQHVTILSLRDMSWIESPCPQRVIHKAIASKPAMAVYGNCEQVPEFEAVEHFFSELNDVVKKSA